MRKVVKRVPATTNNITTGIINFLLSEGHSASRVNVQGQWDEAFQMWRKSGSRKGFYDIAATIKTRYLDIQGNPIGVTLAIDIKKGKDSLSDDQIAFKAEIEAAGGVTFESTNYNDFVFWWHSYIKPNYL